MGTFIVSYDRSAGDDYNKLYEAIKSYDKWWHGLDSTWVIVTSQTAEQVRDNLKKHLDWNDKLLVVKSGGVAAWYGFNEELSQWLKDNI